jgi:hypothetical protein
MLAYTGGHTDGRGTHRGIDGAGGVALAGEGTTGYARMSSVATVLWGPVVGFLYALLMPVIGIATVAALSARMVLGTLHHLAVKSISYGWRPQNAYLSGRKKIQGKRKCTL